MRIKSLLAVAITGLSLAVTACGTEAVQVPDSTPAPAPAAAAQQDSQTVTEMAACKLAWTCNYKNYYSTQAQCQTYCGTTPCDHDYACTGGCVCP